MQKIVNLDMDGTLNRFYDVEGWLADLEARNPRPYIEAKPACNFSVLARRLNSLNRKGYKIRIVSWLARNSDADYDAVVTQAKKDWLKKHLPSVDFDEIIIAAYGVPKQTLSAGILFDDEARNRDAWGEGAYDVQDLCGMLKAIEEAKV